MRTNAIGLGFRAGQRRPPDHEYYVDAMADKMG